MKTESPKIFFGPNIKFLRERRKISQESLAEKLHVTRAKLAALEIGQTKAPQPEDYIRFSDFFTISIDSLIKADLSKLGELKLRELEAGNDVYIMGGKIRVLAITVDKEQKENTEYVPVHAKAGYTSGYNDPQFIAQLPKFSLPNLPTDKSFRMFPIAGDSMLPIVQGSEIIAEYVEDWKNLKPQTPCVVILNGQQDFVFKMVTLQQRTFLLESLNTTYKPYEVGIADVLEIWQFYSYHSRHMPDGPTEMKEVKVLIDQILADMQILKKKKQ